MYRLTVMEEEIINEFEAEEKPPRSDNRIKDLSEKVKTTAEERDKFAQEKADAEAAVQAAKKETDFYKGFSAINSKYPGASEYQDKILEKVNAGYEMEDAAISILAKEGKLTTPAERVESPAGGSAATSMANPDDKPLAEMTRDEKRAKLEEIERETGGVSQILRRGL